MLHYFSGDHPIVALCKKVTLGTFPAETEDGRFDHPGTNACVKCCRYILDDCKRGSYNKKVVRPVQ